MERPVLLSLFHLHREALFRTTEIEWRGSYHVHDSIGPGIRCILRLAPVVER